MRTRSAAYFTCIRGPFKYSGFTPCIAANQHLSRNSAFRTLSHRVMFQTLPLSSHARYISGGSGDKTNLAMHAT